MKNKNNQKEETMEIVKVTKCTFTKKECFQPSCFSKWHTCPTLKEYQEKSKKEIAK
jgi:hypothetical protein